MAKQVSYNSISIARRRAKAKAAIKEQKLNHVIALVSEMSEEKLDAMILLLDPPADDEFEFSEQDKLEVNERTVRYERGIDKGFSAAEVARQAREAVKKFKQ